MVVKIVYTEDSRVRIAKTPERVTPMCFDGSTTSYLVPHVDCVLVLCVTCASGSACGIGQPDQELPVSRHCARVIALQHAF